MMGFSLFSIQDIKRVKYLSRQGLECKTAVEFGKTFAEFNCSKVKTKTKTADFPAWLFSRYRCSSSRSPTPLLPSPWAHPLTVAARWWWKPDQRWRWMKVGGNGGGDGVGWWSRSLKNRKKFNCRTPLVQMPSEAFKEFSWSLGCLSDRLGLKNCRFHHLQLLGTETLKFEF